MDLLKINGRQTYRSQDGIILHENSWSMIKKEKTNCKKKKNHLSQLLLLIELVSFVLITHQPICHPNANTHTHTHLFSAPCCGRYWLVSTNTST